MILSVLFLPFNFQYDRFPGEIVYGDFPDLEENSLRFSGFTAEEFGVNVIGVDLERKSLSLVDRLHTSFTVTVACRLVSNCETFLEKLNVEVAVFRALPLLYAMG